MNAFYRITNPVQHYEWGSRIALSTLFGLPNPEGVPQAELWMGAHPNGGALVELDGVPTRLADLIAAHRTALRQGGKGDYSPLATPSRRGSAAPNHPSALR
ncbi:type I phosphomannose isomerase catalytic subunit [Aeromonas simiae]|uniref:Phosphomannose isomerase type I catalytic domain-containing protein n=1 Tax=Aeromonas simiae TaxID=218936 RepID=A0A5J6WZV2_9GAMM|nr:type I phosphomannose isomerase catalytic subunit [Aeromonas simiae]QFI56602.1 hypothetical protein FE240_04010 [Aeromonas simiae]